MMAVLLLQTWGVEDVKIIPSGEIVDLQTVGLTCAPILGEGTRLFAQRAARKRPLGEGALWTKSGRSDKPYSSCIKLFKFYSSML